MDDPQQNRTELTCLADRVVEAEALVRRLQQRVDNLSGDRPPSDDAESTWPIQQNPSDANSGVELEQLAQWVDRIQERYAATGDWLRPCWWRHGSVIEELAALHTAWMGVYQATEPPAPTAALKWHEEAEKCRERIRRAISTGPGCTAVTHKPDQSVTGDPRWTEERAAMHCESPECPGQPSA